MTDEELIHDEIVAQAVQILRFAAQQRTAIGRKLMAMQKQLIAKLQEQNLTEVNKTEVAQLIDDSNKIIEENYGKMAGQLEMTDLSKTVAERTVAGLNIILGAEALSIPTTDYFNSVASDVLIQGAPSADWWAAQAASVQFKFAAQLRQGLVGGETNQQIIARIVGTKLTPGIMDISKREAASLVQTSVQAVANDARRATFQNNLDVVNGIMQVSTLDSHTTVICIAYSGATWDMEYKPINGNDLPYNGGVPRHFNCRSVEVPITKTFKELGVDIPEPKPGTRASTIGPVPSDITFDAFLKRMGTAWQNKTLGVGRAQLWRDGKITLRDLVNNDGQPLTLEELRATFDL